MIKKQTKISTYFQTDCSLPEKYVEKSIEDVWTKREAPVENHSAQQLLKNCLFWQ